MQEKDKPAARAAAIHHRGAIEAYIRARRAYEDEASAYWQSVVDKRRGRNAKRRNNETIVLDDYVLTQPPIYTGPPRPPGYVPPRRDPAQPALPIPGIADFLKAAAAHYSFVPDRPKTEIGIQAGLRQGGGGRRPHQGSGGPHLCLRDRRQRHL